MDIPTFGLERWLHTPNKFHLGGAGVIQLQLKELVENVDMDLPLSYRGVTNGSNEIRKQIASLYPNAAEENVLVTTGTAEANYLVLNSLLEPQDEVVALLPSYWQCVGIAKRLGAVVRISELSPEEGYHLNPDRLKSVVTSKTKVISLGNPNNPTGSVFSEEEMDVICAIASQVGAWVLVDGALRGLEVDAPKAATPMKYERGIATGSLTKSGLMGLRIGWVVSDPALINRCWIYKDYTTLSHSGIGEYFATIALQESKYEWILKRAKTYIHERSRILEDWIAENHQLATWVPSRAGHTGFIKYSLPLDSVAFCTQLLEEEGLLLSPGEYFGGQGYARFRYSVDESLLKEGLSRLGNFLRRHQTDR